MPKLDLHNDSIFYDRCFKVISKGYFYTDRYSLCIKAIEKCDSLGLHSPSLDIFQILSYLSIGNKKKALSLYHAYLPEVDEYDKNSLSYFLSDNAQTKLTSLLDLFRQTADKSDEISSLNLNSVHEEAMRRSEMRHRDRIRSAAFKYGTLIAVLVLISFLLIWVVYRRKKANEKLKSFNKCILQEKENAINERDELETELNELRHLYEDARCDTTILKKAGLKLSRLLSVISKETEKSVLKPGTSLGKIKIELDKYRPGDRNLKDWEALLNQKYDNILENLSHDIPDLTKEEKAISVYLIMGFTKASISYLCDLKVRQEEFMITKLRNKIKALPEEKRKRYRLLMSIREEEGLATTEGEKD